MHPRLQAVLEHLRNAPSLLWHRVLTALRVLAEGSSVTDAAHAAGFAGAAHFTRTTHRMNGATPSEMGPLGRWLVNCR